MSLIGLGFWVSLGLAVAEFFGWISIGWWLVAAPLLIALGISLVLFIVGLVIGLIGLIVMAITNK